MMGPHMVTANIIFGPPGTGKTTELINIVGQLLDDGFRPWEIMYVAFTRRAAKEARIRATDKFQMKETDMRWFKTLHALAFQQVGTGANSLMSMGDYVKIAELTGYPLTLNYSRDGDPQMRVTKGDRLLFMENMARSKLMSLKDYWELYPDEDIYWYELQRVAEIISKYKEAHEKLDYTDMIQRFVDFIENPTPDGVKALIVDEVQDLTPLQWLMVDRLADKVQEYYMAGDDDQSIFKWAGADADRLINMKGHRRVLDQSYRVPAKVAEVANQIAARISVRVPKVWKPRDEEGVVEFQNNLENIDMSEGTWLLLARNSYLLNPFNEHCLREGFVFESSIGSPIKTDQFAAIKSWEDLRAGNPIHGRQVKVLYDHMSVKVGVAYGFKTRAEEIDDASHWDLATLRSKLGLLLDERFSWNQALDKLRPHEVEYFMVALRRGERFLMEPRIRISTIHTVKGAEADNVVLFTDMADRTFREYQQYPDDEHRVWYVGVTRAKQRLIVMSPITNRFYDI